MCEKKESSIGRLMACRSVNDWDELYDKICVGCPRKENKGDISCQCRALKTIGTMGAMSVVTGSPESVVYLANFLREALEKID